MADAGDHSAAIANRKGHGGRTRVRRKSLPKPYAPLGGIRQLNRTELWQRAADAPSRQHMQRPYPREDFRENIGALHDGIWRRARAERTACFDTTWAQLAALAGRDEADFRFHSSMQAYAALLEEIGVAQIYGVQDASGAWRRLEVRLLDPDADSSRSRSPSDTTGLRSCSSSATGRRSGAPARVAVRRRESRRERHANRHQPHRRRTGQGVTKPRYRLFFQPSKLGSPLWSSPTSSGTTTNSAAGAQARRGRRAQPPPSDSASVGAALDSVRKAALTGQVEALLAAARAAAAVTTPDRIGEVAFRCLFGIEPMLSKKRRMQLRRSAAQLERTAFFGRGAEPGLAAEWLVRVMVAHPGSLRETGPPAPAPRPKSLAFFVVKLRRQARTWRNHERARRAQPKGE